MAATALIKFTQGASVGSGQALKGTTGTLASVENVDNTDVLSWQIDLVYVDPSSGISTATPFSYSDSGSSPIANFTPDVKGSYRWVLKVWDAAGRSGDPTDTDIRIFAVPETNGLVTPPAQLWPDPLPVPASGEPNAKPTEYNFSGQPDGWAGDGSSDGLLNELVRRVDALQDTFLALAGGTMAGAISMGGNDISNFRKDGTSSAYSLTAGSSLTQVFSHTVPTGVLGTNFPSLLVFGARIFAWNTDFSEVGYADLTACLSYNGTSFTIQSETWDLHLPYSWATDLTVSTRDIQILVRPAAGVNGKVQVSLWYHPAQEPV